MSVLPCTVYGYTRYGLLLQLCKSQSPVCSYTQTAVTVSRLRTNQQSGLIYKQNVPPNSEAEDLKAALRFNYRPPQLRFNVLTQLYLRYRQLIYYCNLLNHSKELLNRSIRGVSPVLAEL